VLSFDITHQLTDLLIAIEAAAHHHDSVAHHHDPLPPDLAAVFINPPNRYRSPTTPGTPSPTAPPACWPVSPPCCGHRPGSRC